MKRIIHFREFLSPKVQEIFDSLSFASRVAVEDAFFPEGPMGVLLPSQQEAIDAISRAILDLDLSTDEAIDLDRQVSEKLGRQLGMNFFALRAVQFLHGGTQPRYFEGTPTWYSRVADILPPATGYTPWNTGADHRRKFLNANARLVRSVGARPERSAVGFWGEWEPPSLADPVTEYIEHGVRHVHYPVFAYDNNEWGRLVGPSRSGNSDCMNTDPFVFGCEFYYVCCHQEKFPTMRNLERGSVILFGSRRSHEFVLDTVFVVADYLRWPEDRELIERRTPTIYHRVTLDYLDPNPLPEPKEPVKFYIGATYERPVHGMFSYVPCLERSGAPDGFVRPKIEYSDALPFISPDKTQGISTRLLVDLDEAQSTWNAVTDVVTRAGLCLGFEMEMPVDATTHQQGRGVI